MRKRVLNPGFFKNEELGELDPLARLLFAGLWCFADREGRFKWKPRRIAIEILPYDMGCDVNNLLSDLASSRLIIRYSVNGEEYGEICKFLQYQTPHRRESKSTLPGPGTGQGQAKDSPRLPVPVPVPVPVNTLCPASLEAAQLLKDLLLREKPNARIPKDLIKGKHSWYNVMEKMIRLDKRDPPKIMEMIRWLYNENLQDEIQFVVQSADALRKKFDRIEHQMEKRKPRRAESPTKHLECKICSSYQNVPDWLNAEGICERCETLPPS